MIKTTHSGMAAALLFIGAATMMAEHGGSQANETRLKTRLAGAAISGVQPEGTADSGNLKWPSVEVCFGPPS